MKSVLERNPKEKGGEKMAILAECPGCRKRQSIKNKLCSCGENLDKAKQSKRIKYWIDYRLKDGSHHREALSKFDDVNPYSSDDAKAVLSKRVVQKKENRIFDIKAESNITFKELSDWYLGLESVKKLDSYFQISNGLRKFNLEFGSRIVRDIKPSELEDYKTKREKAEAAWSTIDQEIGAAKTAVTKAFFDRMVDDDTYKNFKRVKKFLTGKKKNSNARDRILSHAEYSSIYFNLAPHVRGPFLMGYYTGMRHEEPLSLIWPMVSLRERKITLPPEITKDEEERIIPIGDTLYSFLRKIPTPLHDNHVFLNNGKPIRDFRGALASACKKAGVIYGRYEKDGFIFHDLRHTFVTNMRKAGVHDAVTNAITGHSDGTMRSRYDKVDFDDMIKGIKKLEEYLGSVDQSVDQTPSSTKKEVSHISANPLN
jgi:integrase